VWGVAFSPDGTLLATASIDETVKLWSLADGATAPAGGTLINTLKQHNSGVRSVAFNAEGTVLASVGDDETVVLWNIPEILQLQSLRYGCAWISDYLRTSSAVAESDRRLCEGL
jgi:WD40 repeat protein